LVDIVERLEIIEFSTGLTQTKLLSIFDELPCRHFESGTQMLARSLKTDWDPLCEYPLNGKSRHPDTLYFNIPSWSFFEWRQGVPCHGSDLLSLSISLGSSCYLKYKIATCPGIPPKAGTPLLFYPLWTKTRFDRWQSNGDWYYDDYDEACHATLVRLLLAAGADPNEDCCGLTPWSVILRRICSGCEDDLPLRRVVPPDAVIQPKESFLNRLEIAKLMLQHNADPFFQLETPHLTISPQIFAELLERECCSENALKHCFCAYAIQIEPQLTELAELVEVRRYQKQQMRTGGELLLIEAWLVVVLAYIVQSFLTSSF
jgi:hypothetical protein